MATYAPSTATKRTIVTMAYEEASLAGYEFDLTPEEQFTAMRRLDALMAEWAPTLPLGYNFPASFGRGNLDDPAGIPDFAVDVAAKYLALRIFPMMGKSISGESRYALSAGMVALRAQATFVPNGILPITTVRGSGNKPWSTINPYFRNDSLNATPSLSALALAASNPVATVAFTTVILNTLNGSTLTLVDNVNGAWSLSSAVTGTDTNGVAVTTWSLNRNAPGFLGGIEQPVVEESLGSAYGNARSTRFVVTVANSPLLVATKFNTRLNSGYVPILAF